MPDSGPQGTLAFPDASAVGRDPETLVRFFSEAPISERVLANSVAAYDRHVRIIVEPEARRRVDEYFSSDEGKAQLQGMSEWQIDYAFEQERKRMFEVVREEEGLRPKLSAPMAAVTVRAGQMSAWRGLLGNEADEQVVLDHEIQTPRGNMTVGEIVDLYGTPAWLQEAVTAAGDLRSEWRLEELLQETRKSNAYSERLLAIERNRDLQGGY